MRLGTAVILGAGIAGLAAARALAPITDRVVVLERRATFAPLGAGLTLASNALAVLARIGVDPSGRGRFVPRFELRTSAGRVLQSTDEAAAPTWKVLGIHRAALHDALAAELPAHVALHLGVDARWDEDPDGVDVAFGADALRADLLVAADGLRSATRIRLGGPKPRYAGYTCWRALVPDAGLDVAFEALGRGTRFGAVPIGDGLAYLFLVADAVEGAASPDRSAVLARFAAFAPPVPDLLARAGALLHHDLFDLPGAGWGRGRVWWIGDAAHATLPNEGQGAAMAIEDAWALRLALEAADLPSAHARLVALRHDRVTRIQRDSRRVGAVFQWSHPWAAGARDLALGLAPGALMRRQLTAIVAPGLGLAGAPVSP